MKSPGSALVIAFLTLMINATLTSPAGADCTADIRALRSQVAAIKDERRRLEVQKLLEKAEKDNEAGRARLCADAVQHARALLK
jgi:hypothetical protein